MRPLDDDDHAQEPETPPSTAARAKPLRRARGTVAPPRAAAAPSVVPAAVPTSPDAPAAALGPFPDPVEALIPHGSICTLSGASGVGKTAFLASLIADLQQGRPILGHVSHAPRAIGVLACDRPWRDHAAWFAKANCAPFPHLSLRDEEFGWEILRDRDRIPKVFGSLVDRLELPPGSLLVVDPVALFLPGRLNDYKDMAIGLGLLDRELKPRHLTLLGIFHVGKQKSSAQDRYTRPQDRILGSSALIGYSETAFYLLSPEDVQKSTYEFGYVAHQLPAAAFGYRRDSATGLFTAADALDEAHEENALLDCLPAAGEVISRSALLSLGQQRLNTSTASLEAVLKRLMRDHRVERVGRGLFARADVTIN